MANACEALPAVLAGLPGPLGGNARAKLPAAQLVRGRGEGIRELVNVEVSMDDIPTALSP